MSSARLPGTRAAAAPCRARQAMRAPTVGAAPQPAEARASRRRRSKHPPPPVVVSPASRRPREGSAARRRGAGLDHPFGIGDGGVQVALQGRQGDVDHRRVDEGHGRAQGHGGQGPGAGCSGCDVGGIGGVLRGFLRGWASASGAPLGAGRAPGGQLFHAGAGRLLYWRHFTIEVAGDAAGGFAATALPEVWRQRARRRRVTGDG